MGSEKIKSLFPVFKAGQKLKACAVPWEKAGETRTDLIVVFYQNKPIHIKSSCEYQYKGKQK